MSSDALPDQLLNTLSTQGWAYSDALLTHEGLHSLIEVAQNQWEHGLFNDAGIGSDRLRHESIRTDKILWLEPRRTSAENEILEQFEKWKQQLNRELFLNINNMEFHWAHYERGGHYDTHVDQPRRTQSSTLSLQSERVISLVLYLNSSWRPDHGGELEIETLENGTTIKHIIEPRGGRVVLFNSQTIRHSVLKNHHPRWSLTGWFRRDPSA